MSLHVSTRGRSRPKRKVFTSIALALTWILSSAPAALAQPDLLARIPGLNKLAEARIPAPLGRLLKRAGIETRGDTLLSTVHPGYREPVAPDPDAEAMMDRARSRDVVVDIDDRIFDSATIELGLWHSSEFLKSYGTALFLAAPFDEERVPLVLVHGINGSPRDFAKLISRLAGSPYQPILFFYPTGMPLPDAGAELDERLRAFTRRHHVQQFAIVAHSMGGLVVKGMLDQFDAPPALRLFVAMSSPWGGIGLAEHAGQVPRHPPCWDDLAATSPFIRRINANPFPATVPFYVFFGARGGSSILSTGSSDGVVALSASVDAPITKSARDVFGFYEDHNSILAAPIVYQRLASVLAQEMSLPRVARQQNDRAR